MKTLLTICSIAAVFAGLGVVSAKAEDTSRNRMAVHHRHHMVHHYRHHHHMHHDR